MPPAVPATATACSGCWRRKVDSQPNPPSCIELTHWPVVHLISMGEENADLIVCRLRQIEGFMRAGHRIALVIEPREAKGRRRDRTMEEWVEAHKDLVQRHCAGVALVITSPIVRFVISSVLLMMSQPVAYAAFEDPKSAIAWAKKKLGP